MQTPEIVLAAVLSTIILLGIAGSALARAESRFVRWASRITSRPRWFTAWVLIFLLWAVLRSIIQHRVDWDTILIFMLGSGVPYFVENLLKSQTQEQMELLTELVVAIKQELDQSKQRDEASGERDAVLISLCSQTASVLTAVKQHFGGV